MPGDWAMWSFGWVHFPDSDSACILSVVWLFCLFSYYDLTNFPLPNVVCFKFLLFTDAWFQINISTTNYYQCCHSSLLIKCQFFLLFNTDTEKYIRKKITQYYFFFSLSTFKVRCLSQITEEQQKQNLSKCASTPMCSWQGSGTCHHGL